MKRLILLLPVFLCWQIIAFAQPQITGYEYWFDNDFSSRIDSSVSATSGLQISKSMSTAGLNEGIHCFNFRSFDDSGRYSSIVSEFFYKAPSPVASISNRITSYEYWIDQDYNAASTVAVPNSAVLNLTATLNLPTLLPGLHMISFRFKDSTGLWSSIRSDFIYRMAPISLASNTDLVEYEYWFDNDFGNRQAQVISNRQVLMLSDTLSTMSLNEGFHVLNIRFRDSTGLWSSIRSDMFYKIPQIGRAHV